MQKNMGIATQMGVFGSSSVISGSGAGTGVGSGVGVGVGLSVASVRLEELLDCPSQLDSYSPALLSGLHLEHGPYPAASACWMVIGWELCRYEHSSLWYFVPVSVT